MENIFVINLKHRVDRLEMAKKQMQENNLSWERFDAIKYDPAIHGYKDAFENFKKNKIENNLSQSYVDRGYLEGCFGCILSHYNVIKLAKERGYERVAIFEDDFMLMEGWQDNLKRCLDDLKEREWDMFYLSGNNTKPIIPITSNIGKPQQCFTTGAYILNSSLFDYILDNVVYYKVEIDVFYAEMVQQKFKVFVPIKNIIRQAPSYSDIQKLQANYNF